MSNVFVISYYFSVMVQCIAFFIQAYGYQLKVVPSLIPLKYALNIEFFVSIVELLVYIWIGFSLNDYNSVMSKRYLDWFITTNFLLISFSLMFIFFNERQTAKSAEETKKVHDKKSLIDDNIRSFSPILLFNNLMLLVGYMGEKHVISKYYSTSIGFVFFLLSFYYLYNSFAKFTFTGRRILYVLAFVWALYGVAHTFQDKWKNTCYNLLDLISKNAFGIIVVFMLIHYQKKAII